MRFVIFGAGAIGCAIGVALSLTGVRVCMVARGATLEELKGQGITLQSPDGAVRTARPEVIATKDLQCRRGDTVILAVKSQATEEAIRNLALVAPPDIPVICTQNGVENERIALRRFSHVYGGLTLLPAYLSSPGYVECDIGSGVLDIGRFPGGCDDVARSVSEVFSAAGFSSRAVSDIMRWKNAKLIQSVKTSVNALCPPGEKREVIAAQLLQEAETCLRIAGMAFATEGELNARRRAAKPPAPQESSAPKGERSSLWQSLRRKTRDVEADFFNGEIALLGRLHGVACAANVVIQQQLNAAARRCDLPCSVTPQEVLGLIQALRET